MDPEEQEANVEHAGTGLYEIHQTRVYTAPPIVNGRIPKNAYGNLDIYTPSMIPPGGVHVQHPDTVRAAKLVGIDFADAVTGFSFKGRHGTAVVNGAVVACEYREAVVEVITAFADDRARAEQEQRSLEAMHMWKRFLAGLRIRQRIEGYDVEGERDTNHQEAEDSDSGLTEYSEGGGFFPEHDADCVAQPTAGRTDDIRVQAGYHLPVATSQVQVAWTSHQPPDRFLDRIENDEGGGFMVDNEDAEQAMQETSRATNQEHLPMTMSTGRNEASPIPVISDLDPKPLVKPIEETAQDGGGFMLEDDDHIEAHAADSAPGKPGMDLNLTPKQFAEAKQLQELYETDAMDIESSEKAEHVEVSPSPMNVESPSAGETQSPSTIHSPRKANEKSSDTNPKYRLQAPSLKPETSEEDKGSLMSEDPEDEDAEPEWLA